MEYQNAHINDSDIHQMANAMFYRDSNSTWMNHNRYEKNKT